MYNLSFSLCLLFPDTYLTAGSIEGNSSVQPKVAVCLWLPTFSCSLQQELFARLHSRPNAAPPSPSQAYNRLASQRGAVDSGLISPGSPPGYGDVELGYTVAHVQTFPVAISTAYWRSRILRKAHGLRPSCMIDFLVTIPRSRMLVILIVSFLKTGGFSWLTGALEANYG